MTGINDVALGRLRPQAHRRSTVPAGHDSEPSELIYFTVYKSQMPVRTGDRDRSFDARIGQSRGCCLEMICADFLSGRQQSGDPVAIHLSLLQVPAQPQQETFLSEVNRKAS
jgi:hypothetical protein